MNCNAYRGTEPEEFVLPATQGDVITGEFDFAPTDQYDIVRLPGDPLLWAKANSERATRERSGLCGSDDVSHGVSPVHPGRSDVP